MGKIQLRRFEIMLDSNKRIYELGETIAGKCVIALEGELQLSRIRMQLIGLVKVKWSEDMGSSNHRRNRTFHDSLQYLNWSYDFVRNTFDGIITKGIHEFPFSYQLPKEGIPSSFDEHHGSVKYWIEAEIEKPLFSFNHKTRTDFEVEAPLVYHNLMYPINGNNEKKIGFLWSNSGDVSIDVTIDRQGYCQGQFIDVKCNVVNKSSVKVHPRATLKQTQTFIAKKKHKIKETKFLRIDGSQVDSGLTNVETLEVPIPANIQLSIDCPILMVSYELHVTLEIPSSLNLHVDLPVIITKSSALQKSSSLSTDSNAYKTDMFYVNI